MKRGTGEVLVDGIHGHDSQNIYWNARVRGYLSIFYTLCNEFNHQLHATIKNLLPINSNQKIESSTRIRTLTISSLVLTGRKKDEPKAKHLCASWFKAFCLEEALVTMCKIDILSMWLLNPFLTRSTSISITGWHDVEKIFNFWLDKLQKHKWTNPNLHTILAYKTNTIPHDFKIAIPQITTRAVLPGEKTMRNNF